MPDTFLDDLNEVLMDVYYHILRQEEYTLKNSYKVQLSVNEMHLIEWVGKSGGEGRTISELATLLAIKPPSVTVAVNKLEKKGFVRKESSASDGRVVRVYLTREGRHIDTYHKIYHRSMSRKISEAFSEEEKAYLLEAVRKLREFFKESIGEKP